MEALVWNTYTDFQQEIQQLIDEQYRAYAAAMRQGIRTEALQKRLLRLELIRQASGYWDPETIGSAFTYIKLFAHV